MFETFKGLLLELGPNPGFPFVGEKVEGGDDVGKIWDKFPVKVGKSSERPDSFDQGGGLPFLYGLQLLSIHLDFPLANDHA